MKYVTLGLEPLEDRFCPSQTDLLLFEQTQLPQLQYQFVQIVPIMQQQLQNEVDSIKGFVSTLPLSYQYNFEIPLIEAQNAVNTFPGFALDQFVVDVTAHETYLLELGTNEQDSSASTDSNSDTTYGLRHDQYGIHYNANANASFSVASQTSLTSNSESEAKTSSESKL